MEKKRSFEQEMADTNVEIGTGSIFEQLGFENFKEMETKADLVIEIKNTIKKRKLTQVKAAQLLNISPFEFDKVLKSRFREYSIKKLKYFLNTLVLG